MKKLTYKVPNIIQGWIRACSNLNYHNNIKKRIYNLTCFLYINCKRERDILVQYKINKYLYSPFVRDNTLSFL